jgi:hypothetical protein
MAENTQAATRDALDHSGGQIGLLDHGGFHRDGHPRGHRPQPDHLAPQGAFRSGEG